MILIGVGSNLPSAKFGTPLQTCMAALAELDERGIALGKLSRWYESAPVPPSGQPWFINAVAGVATELPAEAVLSVLHEVESLFGRIRRERNEARILDLDLLAYDRLVTVGPPMLPHPRMHQRAFVLLPLADVAPDWRHPATGETIDALIAALPRDQTARPIRD